MQLHLSRLVVAVALSPLVAAVSLADFKPRASDLPSACDKVYKASILGCQPSDFTGSACSALCIKALQNYVGDVQKACFGQQGTNIITAFLTPSGPSNLCMNAPSSSSSSSSTASSSSSQSSSSTTTTPTMSSSPQSTSTAAASTTATTDSSTSAGPTRPAATAGSGGSGSPFDFAPNALSAASVSMKLSLALLGPVGLGFVLVL